MRCAVSRVVCSRCRYWRKGWCCQWDVQTTIGASCRLGVFEGAQLRIPFEGGPWVPVDGVLVSEGESWTGGRSLG
jgi:hypothetical protein